MVSTSAVETTHDPAIETLFTDNLSSETGACAMDEGAHSVN